MNILGIDPGKTGAFALLTEHRKVVQITPIPLVKAAKGNESYDIDAIILLLKQSKQTGEVIAFIEKQQIFPSQGAVSGGNLMFGYGLLIGVIRTLEIPMRIITAKEWNNSIFKGMPPLESKDHKKERSIQVALSLYPQDREKMIRGKSKKIDHNLAEALLIAEYGVSMLCQPL